MKRLMRAVLPTCWSPRKTSLYLSLGEPGFIINYNGVKNVSYKALYFIG